MNKEYIEGGRKETMKKLWENTMSHFNSDEVYTEKDEKVRQEIIRLVCLQCNQPGHSFCNKD